MDNEESNWFIISCSIFCIPQWHQWLKRFGVFDWVIYRLISIHVPKFCAFYSCWRRKYGLREMYFRRTKLLPAFILLYVALEKYKPIRSSSPFDVRLLRDRTYFWKIDRHVSKAAYLFKERHPNKSWCLQKSKRMRKTQNCIKVS